MDTQAYTGRGPPGARGHMAPGAYYNPLWAIIHEVGKEIKENNWAHFPQLVHLMS